MVSLLSYQKAVFVKFPIVTKFVFRAFLYLNSSSLHGILNRYWAHTMIKVTGKVKLVYEIELVCDHLKNTKRKSVTNLESRELSLYTFKLVCRTILETLWGKLQSLLGMKLTTGVTLLLLLVVDNDFFSYHSCWLWNQLHQGTFFILVIGLPVQLNRIPKKLSWKTMVLLEFSEGRNHSCYSVTTQGNPWTHVKQDWYYKVWQATINPLELLLKLIEENFEIYLE